MRSKKPLVVIVEDDLELGDLVKEFFLSQSFDVEQVNLPDQAIEIIKKNQDSPSVVLTDLYFPKDSGFTLIEELKNLNISTPVIMMTVDDEVDTSIKAIEAGAYDYVVKPLHFPQLLISIKRALHFHQVHLTSLELSEILQIKSNEKGLGIPGVIGTSPCMQKVFDIVRRVATSTATVFLSGESGTGKEVMARAIHSLSERKNKPFVAINCSAIPEALLETELFGHTKGAFTGAIDKKVGLFETADGGTLFLDEIADLSLPLQAKILRVLQDRKIKRVGENSEREIDVRIVTATHKSISVEVNEKRFREDLYYRLNVIPVYIPPLRERKEDILLLADYFLGRQAKESGNKRKKLSPKAAQFLLDQFWRGNVRELENALARATILSDQEQIQVEDFLLFDNNNLNDALLVEPTKTETASDCPDVFVSRSLTSLENLNEAYIKFVLQHTNGAKDEAAKILSIDRKTLYRKLAKIPKVENGATLQP